MSVYKKIEILDCTLRDGGYYTDWDFNSSLVDEYFNHIAKVPVDIIELGYRSKTKDGYLGEYFYLPLPTIKRIKAQAGDKKLSIMLNAKDCFDLNITDLLKDCLDDIDLIRIALDPAKIGAGLKLAASVKEMGFEVALNIMYLSKITDDHIFFQHLENVEHVVDYINLVDSYGAIYPDRLSAIIQKIQTLTTVKLGFHGHNNTELAFINTLEAINNQVAIVDATVLGMGRGAGNLRLELLLLHLKKTKGCKVNIDDVSRLVELFSPLLEQYNWGINFPYIVSGIYSLPQKEVMDAVASDRYSISGIVKNIQATDKKEFKKVNKIKADKCFIVGGAKSVVEHHIAVLNYLEQDQDILVIHSSSKHIDDFKNISNPQYLCIAGDELKRIDFLNSKHIKKYIFPPHESRQIEPNIENQTFLELDKIDFINEFHDSPLVISLQLALMTGAKSIYLAGFDGYADSKSRKDHLLMRENQEVINQFTQNGQQLISLTKTIYKNLGKQSIYNKVI
jgi:4-hydroxy 2-oxovalerate aldolase